MPGPNPQQIMQAFSSLMQDPVAMQAMMQGAQQMGIPPEMLQQLMGGAGGAGGPQMPAPPMAGGGQPMPPKAEVEGEGGMPPAEGEGDISPEEMAQGEIDNAGNTWDGVDAPTENDIERLLASPTDSAVESFDAQFGDGAAAKYMKGSPGGTEADEQPEGQGPPETNEAEEY